MPLETNCYEEQMYFEAIVLVYGSFRMYSG